MRRALPAPDPPEVRSMSEVVVCDPLTAAGGPVPGAPAEADREEVAGGLVEEELLVEEISIDGMCGVY
ncbi:MAG TPA: mycofactocin precursor MftA [Acidimicrobiales bacterium]|nr:mycofactocin precursor MftA [Acidimicrobiales bacterium]